MRIYVHVHAHLRMHVSIHCLTPCESAPCLHARTYVCDDRNRNLFKIVYSHCTHAKKKSLFRMLMRIQTCKGMYMYTRERTIEDTRTCTHADNGTSECAHPMTDERASENALMPAQPCQRCARKRTHIYISTQGRAKTQWRVHTNTTACGYNVHTRANTCLSFSNCAATLRTSQTPC